MDDSQCSSSRQDKNKTFKSKKIRLEKVKKWRPAGRVEKRRKVRGRNKRRAGFTTLRARGQSVSTEDSVSCDRGKCTYCGHRCCLNRSDSWESENIKKRKHRSNAKAHRPGKCTKTMISECQQAGSRCAMLSPLCLKANATLEELTSEPKYYEITPQMIHHIVEQLTMWRESVPSTDILYHIQNNYPVNPNSEEAASELATKLIVANLIGIVRALPNDYWRLSTALEKSSKLEDRHVTLFWRLYADTMKPLGMNNKSRLVHSDAQTAPSENSRRDIL